jgi:hypothetical protein
MRIGHGCYWLRIIPNGRLLNEARLTLRFHTGNLIAKFDDDIRFPQISSFLYDMRYAIYNLETLSFHGTTNNLRSNILSGFVLRLFQDKVSRCNESYDQSSGVWYKQGRALTHATCETTHTFAYLSFFCTGNGKKCISMYFTSILMCSC